MAKSTIQYKPVTAEDTDMVMDLVRRTFYIDEPMNKAVNLCVDGKCEELDEYCAHALHAGLSFKAVDGDGNVVGVMISDMTTLKEEAESVNPYIKMAEECKNPKFQKILYVLAQREDGAKLKEKFPDEKQYMDVKVAATDPNFRKRGIMNNLLKETEDLAKEKGIKLLRMDTSSAYSAMSAERLGFTCIYSCAYVDIKRDGQPLLVPEAPHEKDSVYIKLLKT